MQFSILFVLLLLALPAWSLNCPALAQAQLPDTTIQVAAVVPAGNFTAPYGNPVADLPEFCRVAGTIRPTPDSDIRFEVWLPVSGWNQKYLGVGNGGFAGRIEFDQLGTTLKRGYATAGTDTGHQADGTDASWAYKHPEKINDFGWRALHLTTENAKRLIELYYGTSAKRAYFDSCSDGGREALMEAQRFPNDFDGILAGAPANDWTKLLSAGAANFQVLRDPAAYISSMKLPAISAATLAACDAQDGVKDGIINDPSRCHFDPAVLLCQGEDSLTCLTAPQVRFLKSIYDSASNAHGEAVFPGHTPGGELGAGGWSSWILGEGPGSGASSAFFANYFRYMVFDDPAWNPFNANVDTNLHAAEESTARALNSTDPDLQKFQSHGGKLILYHGWNDPAIPAQSTINYYTAVRAKLGDAQADQFVRLYMVPGMQHCLGGPGATVLGQFGTPAPNGGIFGALEQWVEKGTAPEELTAIKYKSDNPRLGVQMTRPLCPYPQVAQYKGTGDSNDARNFTCAKKGD
jgi:feruloyl esterase